MYLSCESICLACMGARINSQYWGKVVPHTAITPTEYIQLTWSYKFSSNLCASCFHISSCNSGSFILMSIMLYQKALYYLMYNFRHIAMWLYR